MWFNWLSLGIFIIIVIRLMLIMTGNMTAQDKVSKSISWLVGIVLLFVSWNIVTKGIFPNHKVQSEFKVRGIGHEDNSSVKHPQNGARRSDADSVYIRIDMGKKK
ncbi:hypothetical protein ACF3OE_12550 (plasmid) [Capnocytophaga canis]|uniref:hypothetical protein n=1 Tax=Capnocytophaga canis TaxID=1848903 RepID=UPI00370D12A0